MAHPEEVARHPAQREHHGMAICPLHIHEDACMRDWLLPESAAALKLHPNCDLIPTGC